MLVMPRVISAIEGFTSRHGGLPTRIVVPVENWLADREDAFATLATGIPEHLRDLFQRLEFIPVPMQVYIAIDDEGRSFNYGVDGHPGERDTSAALALPSDTTQLVNPPLPNSYIVPEAALAAGEYPGTPPGTEDAVARARLEGMLDAGVRAFIDLTHPNDPLRPYAPLVEAIAGERRLDIRYHRFPIVDVSICDHEQLNDILDAIDANIADGRPVYVHCWGGIGRTGMVVGCWLVRHGRSGEDALKQVEGLFRTMPKASERRHHGKHSPETREQQAMILAWSGYEYSKKAEAADPVWSLIAPEPHATPRVRDQMRGALIGLAVGDALGVPAEFSPPGSFPPVTNMIGGGIFGLAPGEWTDDTSMALCLAESLIERRRFDPADQMQRYVRWWRTGHLSSTGKFFDIGNTIKSALAAFEQTGNPYSGPTGEMTGGNGSLMRLAPVPIFFLGRSQDAIALAADSSRTTNGAPVAVDACRYFAALLTGALRGASKAELLSGVYSPIPGYWEEHPLHPIIQSIAEGSFRTKSDSAIKGTGYAAHALEAALWAFHKSTNFRDGCLLAVNLGDDADSTAAIYGQLAGAFYGELAIPVEWREQLAHKVLIDRYAELLFQLAFGGPPGPGARGAAARKEAERLIAEAGGDPAIAIQQFVATGEQPDGDGNAFATAMNAPMGAQAFEREIHLQLRVALGLSRAQARAS